MPAIHPHRVQDHAATARAPIEACVTSSKPRSKGKEGNVAFKHDTQSMAFCNVLALLLFPQTALNLLR